MARRSRIRPAAFPLAFSLLLAATAAGHAERFGSMLVFGDSLSDNGNTYAASKLTGSPVPPSPPYFDGRFSNGPVWVENLAPLLGVPASKFTDRAFGGADTGLEVSPVPGVEAQVVGSLAPGTQPGRDTLVVVWGGANDYRRGYGTAPNSALVGQTVGNLRESIRLLIAAGANSVLVPNLPDLGNTPEGRARDAASPGTASGLNALVGEHNSQLSGVLAQLRQQNPGVQITLLDVNSLFRDALANPARYGLTNTTVPCLTTVPSQSSTAAGPPSGACGTPQATAASLFWDPLHPTETGHSFIAQFADATLNAAPSGGSAVAARTQVALLADLAETRAINERLAALRAGTGPVSVLGSGFGPLTSESGTAQLAALDTGTRLSLQGASDHPFGVFVYGTHDWGDRGTSDGQTGFSYGSSLVALGADYRVLPGLVFGATFGYAWSSADLDTGGGSDSRNYKLNAYAGFSRGGFWIDGDFGYSFDEYPSITRRTGFEFLPLARGDTRGHTWSFGATTGYDAPLGPVTLGPYLNGRYTRIHIDSFDETGAGPLDLRIDSVDTTSITGSAGLRLTTAFQLGAVAIRPQVRISWQHEFSHDPPQVMASLAGAGLTVSPGVGARDAAVVGAGVELRVSDRLSLVADYEGTVVRANGRDHSVLGKVEVRF